jgi:hypothetical protein
MFPAIFKGSLCVAENTEPKHADHPGSADIAGACRFSRSDRAFCPTMLALSVGSPGLRLSGVDGDRPRQPERPLESAGKKIFMATLWKTWTRSRRFFNLDVAKFSFSGLVNWASEGA